jgi:hypothetical protein
MHSPRFLASLGFAALLVFLVALMPARIVLSIGGLDGGAAVGVTGTPWHGAARRVTVGPVILRDLQWRLEPLGLLRGRIAARIQAKVPDGFVDASIARGFGGRLFVADAELAVPLQLLAPQAVSLGPGGAVSAQIERAEWRGGRIRSVEGRLGLAGVRLPVPQMANVAPGTYVIQFDAPELADDAVLTGELRDEGGALEVRGTVRLPSPGNWEATGVAKARPDAPPELKDALRMLGPATPEGGHEFSVAGSF